MSFPLTWLPPAAWAPGPSSWPGAGGCRAAAGPEASPGGGNARPNWVESLGWVGRDTYSIFYIVYIFYILYMIYIIYLEDVWTCGLPTYRSHFSMGCIEIVLHNLHFTKPDLLGARIVDCVDWIAVAWGQGQTGLKKQFWDAESLFLPPTNTHLWCLRTQSRKSSRSLYGFPKEESFLKTETPIL